MREDPRPFARHVEGVHHVAIICSDYERSKRFYAGTLGLAVIAEEYRADRRSYKLDLAIPGEGGGGGSGGGRIELFSFPSPPPRVSRPEACGLRHLALAVRDMHEAVKDLAAAGVDVEPVRTDAATGRRFTFFADPDGLPIELYESA